MLDPRINPLEPLNLGLVVNFMAIWQTGAIREAISKEGILRVSLSSGIITLTLPERYLSTKCLHVIHIIHVILTNTARLYFPNFRE